LQPGYRERIPGGPYFWDGRSMMHSNLDIRNRHFWHSAEWLRTIYDKPFSVRYDGFVYNLPPHPNAPKQTWVTIPFVAKENVRSGAGGFYDAWLYRLGADQYSVKGLLHGPFDGFLSVNVRMKIKFLDSSGNEETDHDDLTEYASKIFGSVLDRLDGKFFVKGSADGTAFSRAHLSFYPRLLVQNDSGDPDYHKGLDNPAKKSYKELVERTESNFGGSHFIVTITRSGPSGFQVNPSGPGGVVFNQSELKLTKDFPRFFAGMVGAPMSDEALKAGASFLPIAQHVMPDAQIFPLP
jgi:hypothetical protein